MKNSKKSLALLVAALMILSCFSSVFSVISFAEGDIWEAWNGEWNHIDGATAVWQSNSAAPEEEWFSYDYGATYDGENLVIAAKFFGTLTGTSTTYGNANGTNFRIWLRNPSSGYVSYNYFIDVSYIGSGFDARILKNTNANGNTSSPVTAYGAAAQDYPFTWDAKVTTDGADCIVVIPAEFLGNPAKVQVVVSASNKMVKNYCIHSNQDPSAPANVWTNGSLELVKGLKASYVAQGVAAGTTTWKDVSGNGNDIPDVPDNENGRFTGEAYALKGIQVDFPEEIDNIIAGDEFSVELVTGAFEQIGASYATVINCTSDAFALFRTVSSDTLNFKNAGNTRPSAPNGAAQLTNASLTVVFKKGTPSKIYRNGFLLAEATDAATANITSADMWFGQASATKSFALDYKAMRFYDRALSDEEIKALYIADGGSIIEVNCITDNDTPAFGKLTNVAPNAEVTYTVAASNPYVGLLNDGIVPTVVTYASSDNPWYGPKGMGDVIFKLDKKYDNIASFTVDLLAANKSGIKKPTSLSISASDDGENWQKIGNFDLSDPFLSETSDNSKLITLASDKLISAEYIKLSFNGTWTFLGELAINIIEEVPSYSFTTAYDYTIDDIVIIPWTLGDTLGEVKDKTHAWWNFAVVEWCPAHNCYEVGEIYLGTGVEDFRGVEIPEYGFLIGSHASGGADAVAFAAWIKTLSVGTPLYFFADGVDLEKVAIGDKFDAGKVVVSEQSSGPVDAFTPGLTSIKVLTFVGFAGGDVTIIPRIGELKTVDDVAAFIRSVEVGDDTDYNYYAGVVVDGDGKVVEILKTLGRPDGCKGTTEIPEGGYFLGINGGSSLLNKLYIGDKMTLIGVDLGDLVAKTASCSLEDAYVVFRHDHNYAEETFEPNCKDAGYTKLTCICGDVQIVEGEPATGNHDYQNVNCGTYYKEVCSVCGDTKYFTLDGEAPDTLKVSHHNAYNWGTYEAMLVSGDGKTEAQVVGQDCTWWVVYTIENIDGRYIATSYSRNSADNKNIVCPDGGFLYFIYEANSDFSKVLDGALLGYEFIPNGFAIEDGGFAIDTTANPAKEIVIIPKQIIELEPDFDGDGVITSDDAIGLLFLCMSGEEVSLKYDFNGDGKVDSDDAVELLFISLFGE